MNEERSCGKYTLEFKRLRRRAAVLRVDVIQSGPIAVLDDCLAAVSVSSPAPGQ